MAKRQVAVGRITDKEGKAYDPSVRSAGAGNSFKLTPPDYYLATVESLTDQVDDRKFSVNGKQLKNKNNKSGLWTYWSVTPNVVLVNENKTVINRQNFQIGILQDEALIRPDGDKDKPVIWSEGQYLLGALGALKHDEDGNFVVDFDPELILNLVIKVKTGIGGYIKSNRGFNADEFHALLLEVNDGEEFEFEDIPALIAMYNDDNELTDDEFKLKAKNMILQVFPVDKKTIVEKEFYLDEETGAVYISQADFDKFLQLKDASDNYVEPDI